MRGSYLRQQRQAAVCERQQRPPRITTVCTDTWKAVSAIRFRLGRAWRDRANGQECQEHGVYQREGTDECLFSLRGLVAEDALGGLALVAWFGMLMAVAAIAGGA